MESVDEALRFRPHLAVIANPAPFHIATAQVLAEVGAHLFIEKPISISLEGVDNLLDVCRKNNLVLFVGYNLRFMPSLKYFRELLLSGNFGIPMSVRCEMGQYLPSWRPESDYRFTVTARHDLGGGALLELSHEIDYLLWIFGEVQSVQATVRRQSHLDIDVEDTAHLILLFAPNAQNHSVLCSLELDLIRHDTSRCCTAICEEATLQWNGITGEVLLYEKGTKEWQVLLSHPPQRDESYLGEWQDFIMAINGLKEPMVTGQQALNVLKIIDSARNSSLSGERVLVNSKKVWASKS
jgi:predicted dehydrogenase